MVALDPRTRAQPPVLSIDLNTRSLPEEAACEAVRRAFSSRRARDAKILFKKIDSTLRGNVLAELRAAREAIGKRRSVWIAPAFPAQGRTMKDAQVFVHGKRLRTASLKPLASEVGFLLCDAESDVDLRRIARQGLAMKPRPLFVGSAGLARALASFLPRKAAAPRPHIANGSTAVVVGSASEVSMGQAKHLARIATRLGVELFQLEWRHPPTASDLPLVHGFGRIAARQPGCAAYVLTGGETARAVLGARRLRAFRLLGEVEPGIPFGSSIPPRLLLCTKAGGFGGPDTLVHCAMRMKRELEA